MRPLRRLLAVVSGAIFAMAHANLLTAAATPPGGTPVLPEAIDDAVKPSEQTLTKSSIVQDPSAPGGRKWVLVTSGPYDNPWSSQLAGPTTAVVARDDVLLLEVSLRGSSPRETGEAITGIVFEKNGEPHTKSLDFPVTVGTEWRSYQLPFRALEDYAAGGAQVAIRAGYDRQTLEVAGLRVLNYGKSLSVNDLPRTRLSYAGREIDAPWRAEAQARIELHRKADLRVRVIDAHGKPVPGATVSVTQQRHAFPFGSAIVAGRIAGTRPEDARYREAFESYFNAAVFENDLKWWAWESWDQAHVHAALDWLAPRSVLTRGHVLLWPSWRNTPSHLREAEGNPLQLRQRIEGRFRDVLGALRGRLDEWDVVNEPWDNHDITDILGRDSLAHWFTLARQLDDKSVLYLNDYAGLTAGGADTAHKRHFESTLQFLQASGAPLGGIGIQGHFGWTVTPPTRLLAELDRWAAFGIPIAITEFDVNITDEELQGDFTRDFLTAAFSHPSVSAILAWGFWEGSHWMPAAAFFRRDWSERPAGRQWRELTRELWWTRASGSTDASGSFMTRAFLGRHTVSASAGGRSAQSTADLTREGSVLVLRLPDQP